MYGKQENSVLFFKFLQNRSKIYFKCLMSRIDD